VYRESVPLTVLEIMASEDDDKGRRINGLQPPYHYLQIATWFLFPLILVEFEAEEARDEALRLEKLKELTEEKE
jgi:hypothetical protein